MKLLIFAHTPPPHRGQSYMVQLMLDGFGGGARKTLHSVLPTPQSGIGCHHANARFSEDMEDIGAFRLEKAPELVPAEHAEFVPPRASPSVADAIMRLGVLQNASALRAQFMKLYTEKRHVELLGAAFHMLNGTPSHA